MTVLSLRRTKTSIRRILNEIRSTEIQELKSSQTILIKCLKWHNRILVRQTLCFFHVGNKTDEFLNKREMTGASSRTRVSVGIWSGAAKTIQGPLLWHFCRLTGLRVVAAITATVGAVCVPPPLHRRAEPHTRAIHLRYAHKANRTRNGRPTFPLLLNLFISLLILDSNFNVCVKFAFGCLVANDSILTRMSWG